MLYLKKQLTPTEYMEKMNSPEHIVTPSTPDEIRLRIADIDREIISLTTTSRLAEVPAKNELGTSPEEGGIEEEMNYNDYSAVEERVRHLRDEKADLQRRLEENTPPTP